MASSSSGCEGGEVPKREWKEGEEREDGEGGEVWVTESAMGTGRR